MRKELKMEKNEMMLTPLERKISELAPEDRALAGIVCAFILRMITAPHDPDPDDVILGSNALVAVARWGITPEDFLPKNIVPYISDEEVAKHVTSTRYERKGSFGK
jgi:hypothetical protein